MTQMSRVAFESTRSKNENMKESGINAFVTSTGIGIIYFEDLRARQNKRHWIAGK
jgi:hypothetical protein